MYMLYINNIILNKVNNNLEKIFLTLKFWERKYTVYRFNVIIDQSDTKFNNGLMKLT